MQENRNGFLEISRRQSLGLLAVLLVSAAFVRLMLGYTNVHYFDLSFYVDWSAGAAEDLFGAYDMIENLDYPPLFLFPLWITGKLMESPLASVFHPYAMLLLKGWQMLFDLGCIPLIYGALRGRGELFALGAAALWAVNPTIIYNSSYWGQTDSIMIFLLVLAFWTLGRRKPVAAGIVMTLACLMKFQSLYFAPVFALILLTRFCWKQVFRTVGAGVLAAAAVFLPFILRSGWDLPWRIYFGGFEQYPGATINAFNYYGALGLNFEHIDTVLFAGITAGEVSVVMTALALLILVILYFTATVKSAWLLGFVFMQTVFLFTCRMHERYQIPAMAFALMACAAHRSRGMLTSYLLLTVMTFLNHFLVLEYMFAGEEPIAWMAHFDQLVVGMSCANLALYGVTMFFALRVCYRYGYYSLARALPAVLPKGWRRKRECPPGKNESETC